MTPEEFARKMRELVDDDNPESAHIAMDALLCEVLRSLGYGAGAEVFKSARKWYS